MSIKFETHETLLLVRGGNIKAFLVRDRATKALEVRWHLSSGDKYMAKLRGTLSEEAEGIQKVTDREEGSTTPAGFFKNVIKLGINESDFSPRQLLACAFDHRKFESFCVDF